MKNKLLFNSPKKRTLSSYQRILLLPLLSCILFFFISNQAFSQGTLLTVPPVSGTTTWGGITFNLQTSQLIIIDTIYINTSGTIGTNVNLEVWYNPSPINGQPAPFTGSPWVNVISSQTLPAGVNLTPIVIPGGLIIPASSNYGFYIGDPGFSNTGLRYGSSSTVSTVTDGTVTIEMGTNVGYGWVRNTASTSNHPRYFAGGVAYNLGTACTGSPTGGTAIASAPSVCPNQNFSLSLSGQTSASGLLYQWQTAAFAAGPWSNIPGATSASASVSQGSDTYYRCEITCTNSSLSDTSTSVFVTTMPNLAAGTYTIGTGGNYSTFNDAIAAMSCGIAGPVIFNVFDATYNEQIVLPYIIGASDTSTITFQSASGDSTLCVLTYTGSSTVDNYTVKFNGGDYITFNQLTIENPGTTYGRAMEFSNGSTWNNLSNCIIRGDTNNISTSTNKVVVYSGSGSSLDHNNTFSNNLIHGGSYGMYWYGDGSSSLESGTVISGNTFKDQYSYGVRLYYQDAPKFNNNTVSSNTTSATFYRTYFGYCDNALEVIGNKLLGIQNGYGLYIYYCDANNSNQGLLANNFVRVGDALSTTTCYGIYLSSSGFQNIANNNVLIESNGTLSRGLYVTSGGANKVLNNNLVNNGPGYAVYYASTFSVIESDYNNFFAPSGSFSYFSSAYPNLGDWQLNTGYDLNSVSVNPNYYGDQDLHVCNDSLSNMGMPLQMITMDLDGDTRNSIPDIGADEFVPVSSFSLGSDTAICAGMPVTLGFSDASSFYSWSTGANTPAITVSNSGSYFVSITNTCGSASDTIIVTNIPLPVASFNSSTSFLTGIFTNTSVNGSTYLWNFGDGNTSNSDNVSHVYSNTGSYNVKLVVTNECGSDSITTTVFVSPTSINEQLLSEKVSIYPNPNNGLFSIAIGKINSSFNIDIHDMHGKNVYQNNIKAQTGEFNRQIDLTNNISTGVYFIKITTEKEVLVKKIVVN